MDNNTAQMMFSSASDEWETPQNLFDELNAKWRFQLDVAANGKNHKCDTWLGPDSDLNESGLVAGWGQMRCWMNPPYGRDIGKWIKKATEEVKRGATVVALLPARTDTKWFHDFIYRQKNVTVEFIKGRLKFGGSKNSAPFPSMIVVFS